MSIASAVTPHGVNDGGLPRQVQAVVSERLQRQQQIPDGMQREL